MRADALDLPLTTTADAARDAYVRGVELLLTANAGAEAALQGALAADPEFALAHAALARHHQLHGRMDAARSAVARAGTLARNATAREEEHVRILALAIGGQGAAALGALRAHLDLYPRDAVALSLALGVYGLIGFSGRLDHHAEQRALLESLHPRWPEDGWFLGYLGWSQAETGEPARGAATVGRALELLPRNANAAHGLTHAYVELGKAKAGHAFLAAWIEAYDPASILHCHLNWHLALYELDLNRTAEAQARFRATIHPDRGTAPPMPLLADAASYLWRCRLYGAAEPPPPWADIAAFVARAFPAAGLAFADLHAAMAEAATGNVSALENRVAQIERRLADGTLPQGGVVPALCRAVAAYALGEDDRAIKLLEAALPDLPRIGGSHAQREVFEDTLIAACLRAGRHARARELLAARLARRPREQDRRWLAAAT
jgi:tetratricopeptide (TPR) repeat protein